MLPTYPVSLDTGPVIRPGNPTNLAEFSLCSKIPSPTAFFSMLPLSTNNVARHGPDTI